MKAAAKVCFDDTSVGETGSLPLQDGNELPAYEKKPEKKAKELDQAKVVDRTSSILKEDTEQEKVIDEYMLEIESSEEGTSLDFK